MTHTLKTFAFAPGLDLRTIEIDGNPWFVALDVCAVLGHTNPTVALLRIDEADRAKQTLGKGRPANIVNESGLYSLILRSNKPEAKAFKRWVTTTVLPTIRKHGGYMAPELAVQAVEDPAVFMARALVIAHETIKGLQTLSKGMTANANVNSTLLFRAGEADCRS
ncbi:MAG: BRO family protein [Burkholderiaceae bacterium]